MNPSASGWIKKHLPVFEETIVKPALPEEAFYHKLKASGFIYANSIGTLSYPHGTTFQMTLEEISKVNLFDSLGHAFYSQHPQADTSAFLASVISFYDYLKKHSWFNFHLPLLKTSPEGKLEKIIQNRIQTNASSIQKNFSSLIANALLYLDVLTYRHYLKTDNNPVEFAKSLEALLANTIYIALKKKSDKSTHEQLVLKLLETSIRYNTVDEISLAYTALDYTHHKSPLECLYILDLACMTIYADEVLEDKERRFIMRLAQQLGFDKAHIKTAAVDIKHFIHEHKTQITYLDYSNPFRNLYDNTTRMVRMLILRNKKRLSKEIGQSKELVVLLRKSRSAELAPEERAKVKTQLLDICKMIPSLAIFLLPGGSILLPILIKFIPDLLPSAFDDNK